MRQTRGENNYNFSANARNCQIIKSLLKTELMMLKRIFEQVRRWKSHLQSNEQPLFSIRVTGLSWRLSHQPSWINSTRHWASVGILLLFAVWRLFYGRFWVCCVSVPKQHLHITTLLIWTLIVDSSLQVVLSPIQTLVVEPYILLFLISLIYKSSTLGSYKSILGQ